MELNISKRVMTTSRPQDEARREDRMSEGDQHAFADVLFDDLNLV